VIPLAADSLGVRSMCTYVETGEVRLLMEPGATVSPLRFGLEPTPEEREALDRALDRIRAFAVRATLVTVSHFHADHYQLAPALYQGRRVWAKDPRTMLDAHQAAQGRAFWAAVGPLGRLRTSDGELVDLGAATLRFSPPLPHGQEGTSYGYLTVTTVDDGTRFVHAADVQGPVSDVTTAYLVRERPDLLYLSGPPTYLAGQLGPALIDRAIQNLLRVVSETGCRVIMDHHAVREPRYRERLGALFDTGRVVTAAEYAGQREACLEARRAQAWARLRRGAGATGGGPPGRAAATGGEGRAWPR
jgi:predicted metallo-beta-lactamase superfamily hydrolase